MPKKKKSPLSSSDQSARFLEAAKKAEVDESGRMFAKAVGKLIPNKKRPKKAG